MKTNKQGIPAAAFMASFSSAGRIDAGPKVCVHCKANRARWDSIYCSDHCKTQFYAEITDSIDWDEGRDFEDEEHEPECTCQQIDVDIYDARGCEAHGWRVA